MFELLGTTYGGDGVHSFGVPDLRGRAPMHVSKEPARSIALGERGDAQTSLPPFIAPNYIIVLEEGGYDDDPFFCEVRMAAGARPPEGWFTCQGQHLPTRNFAPLFALLGVTYGGDGGSTFALPDLRARAPMYQGQLSDHGPQPCLGLNFCIALEGELPRLA